MPQVPGLDFDTRASSTSCAARWCCRAETPGAAAELNTIATRLQSTYGKGRATHNGKVDHRRRCRGADGHLRNPAELAEMWKSWHENVGRPMRAGLYAHGRDRQPGAKELGYADTGAMWRSQYDMTPEQFSAMYDRLWAR
jgi:peptidyl-dipeptidase A